MRWLLGMNHRKLKLINLIINTDNLTVLRKLEQVFENELDMKWCNGGFKDQVLTDAEKTEMLS